MTTQQRERMLAEDGRQVARALVTPALDLVDVEQLLAPVDVVASLLLREFPGWQVGSAHDGLADALVAAGGRQTRHADVYCRDLDADPPDPGWAHDSALPLHGRMRLLDHGEATLAGEGELSVRAYPPDHVDTETTEPQEAARVLERLYDGEYIGPVLTPSTVVVDDDRVVAVLVVNRMAGTPPLGGPWVSEIFRDPHPAYAGLGSALLRRAMALLAADGEHSLALAVTRGNPARLVYERAGMSRRVSSRRVLLPGAAEGP